MTRIEDGLPGGLGERKWKTGIEIQGLGGKRLRV
jgi:hypothetical protein